jgi:hypothetical protein
MSDVIAPAAGTQALLATCLKDIVDVAAVIETTSEAVPDLMQAELRKIDALADVSVMAFSLCERTKVAGVVSEHFHITSVWQRRRWWHLPHRVPVVIYTAHPWGVLVGVSVHGEVCRAHRSHSAFAPGATFLSSPSRWVHGSSGSPIPTYTLRRLLDMRAGLLALADRVRGSRLMRESLLRAAGA